MSQKANVPPTTTTPAAAAAEKEKSTSQQKPPQTTQEVAVVESERSPHVPMEGVMSQTPLPDTMSVVGSWLKELAQADQNPEPIPHNSPLPSPRATSVQAMQRVARKEASMSAKEGGASIPPPVTASPTFNSNSQLPPTHNNTNPSSHQEVKVRASAEPGAEKTTTSARPPLTNRVSGTAAGMSSSRAAAKGAVLPSVPSAAATGTSSLLPSKSVIDAQVQGLLMCPGWSSIRAASKEVLLSTYSVDPFTAPLDFQKEQGTLGALSLNAHITPPYSPSVHWAVTEKKIANAEIAKVATNGGGIDAASIAERVSQNKKLFAVTAGCS